MIWALQSEKAGEEHQILSLARAARNRFRCPLRFIRLRFRSRLNLLALTRGVGFEGLVVEAMEQLTPPWPKVIITAGFFHEPIARKIRDLSGGETKIIIVGRPWAALEHFDLIVTTPQYQLLRLPNVLENLTTLHGYSRVTLKKASLKAKAFWPKLTPPYVTVLIGGRSGSFRFGEHAARRLAEGLNAMAATMGATLLISTSRRTEIGAIWVLESALKVPYKTYLYQAGIGENPYPVMLGAASAVVVTGDSIAMLSEAVATGLPVQIFDLGAGARTMRPGFRAGPLDRNLGTEIYRLAMLYGPRRLTRDVTLVHQLLVDGRHATWFGDETPTALKPLPPSAMEDTLSRMGTWF